MTPRHENGMENWTTVDVFSSHPAKEIEARWWQPGNGYRKPQADRELSTLPTLPNRVTLPPAMTPIPNGI